MHQAYYFVEYEVLSLQKLPFFQPAEHHLYSPYLVQENFLNLFAEYAFLRDGGGVVTIEKLEHQPSSTHVLVHTTTMGLLSEIPKCLTTVAHLIAAS